MCVQRVAVSSTDWLGLCAWFINQPVIVRTLAVQRLADALRTALHVATEDVQLAFRDATIVARLSICSPIFFLFAVANALKDFSADAKCCGNSIFCQGARIDLTRSRRTFVKGHEQLFV